MKTVSVLSVDIASATRGLLVDEVASLLLRSSECRVIAKVPSEFLVRSLRDEAFGAYLRTSDLNVADGIGVLWAARFLTLKTPRAQVLRQLVILSQAAFSLSTLTLFPRFCRYPIPERIRGLDALFAMLEAAQAAAVSVYFLGAQAEVNQRAREEIGAKYPRLSIAGGRDGYSGDGEELTREIDESGAALLIVALGSPKQEFWIRDHLHELKNVRVAVGEGGTLDLIAGDYRLTPGWMQTVSLEWLWRLFMHRSNKTGGTSRARRVWNAVPVFIYHVVRWKLRHGPVQLGAQGPA